MSIHSTRPPGSGRKVVIAPGFTLHARNLYPMPQAQVDLRGTKSNALNHLPGLGRGEKEATRGKRVGTKEIKVSSAVLLFIKQEDD